MQKKMLVWKKCKISKNQQFSAHFWLFAWLILVVPWSYWYRWIALDLLFKMTYPINQNLVSEKSFISIKCKIAKQTVFFSTFLPVARLILLVLRSYWYHWIALGRSYKMAYPVSLDRVSEKSYWCLHFWKMHQIREYNSPRIWKEMRRTLAYIEANMSTI